VPLAEGADPLKVNWCQTERHRRTGRGALTATAGSPTGPSAPDNVAGLAAAGRARWKIENENNNVLKNRGYHLEHNFGHGKEHLASLLATMNLLAFGLHTLLELTDENYRLIRNKWGARRRFSSTWRP